MKDGYAPLTSPHPPDWSWRSVKRRNDTGFSRIPSRLAHRARPIRQCSADPTSSRLLPPSPATPGSGCLQLHPTATTAGQWRSFTSIRNNSASRRTFCLVTDLLDPEAHPALDLAGAYPMRWGCETVIGDHKTDMGAGMAVLRSKDPEGVAQEMWALFAVYQAIHTLIGAAVDATGIPPDKISFPHALAAATDSAMAGFSPSGS